MLTLDQNYHLGLCEISSQELGIVVYNIIYLLLFRPFCSMYCISIKFLHVCLQAKASGRTPEEYEKKGDLTGVSSPPGCNPFFFHDSSQ